ncbi:MAG: hypothetical protein ACOYM2_17100 [Rectinemataceae bacterium]
MPEPVGASPYLSTAAGPGLRRPGLPMPAEPVLSTEVVFFHLYDVGRSIDLRKAAELIPALDDFDIVKRRDTPASLSLPRALTLSLGDNEVAERGEFESFSAHAKIYAEGAIVLLVRVKLRAAFGDLASVRGSIIVSGDRHLSLDSWAEEAFRKSYSAIRPAVEEPLPDEACERESYTAWCLLECPVDPATFVTDHREAATAFLIGEERGDELHPSQILETLGHPISYRRDDLAIYDLDRCLIIDPRGDYEDILLIIEHANWQLLELRVLDKLLDRWLDEAEDEVQVRGAAKRKRRVRGGRGKSAPWKRARLQSLRFDALFILENLENSSKIIGDYYLGQVYDQLCEVFNTDGWKGAVERRLDILENVYDMVKTDGNENTLITLEIWFIIVCVVIPLVQIWIMLKPTH